MKGGVIITQKEITLLFAYIYNNQVRLEDEIRQLQANIRFRRIDSVDCVELMLATEHLNTFKEVTNDISLLLGLKGDYRREYCLFCRKCKKLFCGCQGFKCYDCSGNCSNSCAYSKDFSVCFVAK